MLKTRARACSISQINCNEIHNIEIISVLFNKCNSSINTFKVVCRQCLIFNFYAETINATYTHTNSATSVQYVLYTFYVYINICIVVFIYVYLKSTLK